LALKIPPERADRLMADFDDGLLRANLAYTEEVYKSGGIRQKPISYLLAALRDNYAGNVETAKATLAVHQAPGTESVLQAEFLTQRAEQALELFRELAPADRQAILDSFLQTANTIVRDQYRRGGWEAPIVKASFARHYAQSVWGEPTAEELLAYANSRLAAPRPGQALRGKGDLEA
jgi:hypothetical protein